MASPTDHNQTALNFDKSVLKENPNSHDLKFMKKLLEDAQSCASTMNFQRMKRLRDDDQNDTRSEIQTLRSIHDSAITSKRKSFKIYFWWVTNCFFRFCQKTIENQN